MAKILLGVGGGIAAYKSCELVRELQRRQHEVRVIMTSAAQKFVTPLTFEALTRSPVMTDLFSDGAFGTAHIETARWADLLAIAPTTANLLSRLARGDASDFLSTVYLAFRGPTLLAPAMNTAMWNHPAVQENLKLLRTRGVHFVDPIEGELACGEAGVGKMAEPSTIFEALVNALGRSASLQGRHVVVTAGPTREYLDPVRFLSSPSTGKMGLAIAREAARRGAAVTLIHGPLTEPSAGFERQISVTSAQEMEAAVSEQTPADIFISAAAIGDFRPKSPSRSKLKRTDSALRLQLEPTNDVVAEVARRKRPGDLVIGFAAETDEITKNAKTKLDRKQIDLIVANRVERELVGFAQDRTSVTFIDRTGTAGALENVTKDDVARALWDRIESLLPRHAHT